MKKVSPFLTLLAVAFCWSACTREEAGPVSVPQMTIRAEVPETPFTKASFSVPEEGTGLHLAWQETDCILVTSGSASAVYQIQPGFTDHVAHFTGDVVPGNQFDIICPGTYESVAAAEAGNLELTQNGNGSTEHLVFTALLSGVAKADLPQIAFNTEWAAGHGAVLKRGGIVKFVLTLPAAVTSPKKVTLSGIGEKEISVKLTNVTLGADRILTAYAQSGWDDIAIQQWDEFTVGVMDADGSFYAAEKQMKMSGKTLKAGAQNTFTITDGFTERLFSGGDGSQAHPYLIANARQLDNMHAEGILKHQERVYFRLIEDIDMAEYLSSHRWVPLNAVNPYDYLVDFDGANHTIDNFSCSYVNGTDAAAQKDPSFFGLLYGTCHDVTFTHATITCDNGPCGILGGYIGYSGKKGVVQNVHVQGSVTKTGATGTHGVGGMAGLVVFAYIDSSSADVEVSSGDQFTGGLIGRDDGDASRIRNCWTSGTVYGQQKVGGIAGGLIRPESELINCFSTATIDALRFAGGIVADCCNDAGSSNHYQQAGTLMLDNVVKGCIAWQTLLRTRDQGGVKDGWASGAIIGLTATHNYLIGCKRNAALDFDDFSPDLTAYDQEDANPDTPLVINNPKPGTYKHYYPYHGKAFSGTLSQAARACGWDETVWDLSGATPVLTGVVQAETQEEAPTSGDALVPSVSTTSRAFPQNGTTQNGLTWTVSEIRNGIRYYRGYGQPTDNWWGHTYFDHANGEYQEIFVVDLDLSYTDYDVKVVVASPSAPTSEVFRQTGAIAAVNGGYEKASIAIKGNMFLNTDTEEYINYPTGYPYSYLPNNTIGDSGVPNWKNEGTFYTDGHQGVRIAFDAYTGGATGKTATDGTTVRSVQEMRKFYRMRTDAEPGLISSAPILDANYVRFGMSFVTRNPSTSNGESPGTHQGSCYSRTAVAIAYPNGDAGEPHLLLIVNDGKYAQSTGRGYGMTAYQLERVIANFFGPKYMLNLDGGGSSTMCVEGKGDEDTNVVNYPSDNYTGKTDTGKVDHAGERSRDTFIVIVPADND